ncbi:YjjG family noncanonical pyrimidine nucleotidase [Cyclobacterium jeungdonense]|uniref:YjjG family noncanonical pyrimidine nucleotidase n=1 Tax=Cyclobacterium jeungdonense TaxID=708087 RepID=A0ABT8C6S6_9BACT|nr:YjjG family noncanonical pyrimidine nucleotidase [Cyclobacterium jeungdonense]MDN3688056.1 YjjG family noncanonical pyrimidine nucleotidase [Cyclobacterium jeungdonense]
MKAYRHLLFDLDHTLWDYDSNVRESLTELYTQHRLADLGGSNFEVFFDAFQATNLELWDQFNSGKVDRGQLRAIRFQKVFTKARLSTALIPRSLEDDFISLTSSKTKVIDQAVEMLQYLGEKYDLHIVTNGFNESQYAKLKASDLERFFKIIVTSESSGFRKPDQRIFAHTLREIGTESKDCLMIGDNPNSDILGARNAFIDQVHFNPENVKSPVQATFTIRHLSELKTFL